MDYEDDSSDETSDDDLGSDSDSGDGGFAKFCGLSPKFQQIIRHQGGTEFAAFFKPHALQITTKADLYEVLGHFRACVHCEHAICHSNM